MKLKSVWCALGVLVSVVVARAAIITYNQPLVNAPALAFNSTYTLDLQANSISQVSAQAVYSSATVANVSFTDGSQSTGSFTVNDYAALKASSATDTVTVAGVPATGDTLYITGYAFINGQDWTTRNVASNTAISLANSIAARVPYLKVSTAGAVITLTAPLGSNYNGVSVVSSSSSLTVATPTLSGGRNNSFFSVNGVVLTQGMQWTAATSSAATAASIAGAINSAPSLSARVSAQASGSVVTSTSSRNGAVYNYPLASSNPSALAVSAARMSGGSDAAFALGSSTFTAAGGVNLSTALAVLYSGTPAIGGLTAQTTYYAVPVSGNSFMLAKYSTSAVAGNVDLVTVTSTNTQLVADTYVLAPLSISGTPSFKWRVSNDNVHWDDLAVSSVTVSSYSNPPATTIWSFGFIGLRYLQLSVVAPTTGALGLNVTMVGTN